MSLTRRVRSKPNVYTPAMTASTYSKAVTYNGYIAESSGTPFALSTSNQGVTGEVMRDYLSGPNTVRLKAFPLTLDSDPPFKECLHTKYETIRTNGVPIDWSGSTSYYPTNVFKTSGGPFNGCSLVASVLTSTYGSNAPSPSGNFVYYNVTNGLFGPPGLTSSDALTKAKSMLNDANLLGFQDFNILAFIAELKDVRRLLDLFKMKHWNDRDVSDKYLGVQFGALPFFGDLMKIIKMLKGVGPAITRWNDMAARGRTMNLHSILDIKENNGTHTYQTGFTTSLGRTTRSGRTTVYQEKVTGRVHLYFKPLPISPDQINALYRSITGFNRPLGAAWELVPFSFVVDWLFNIGDIIDSIESSSPVLQVSLCSAGYSLKQEVTAVTTEWYEINGVQYTVGSVNHKEINYTRLPLDPKNVIKADMFYGPMSYVGSVGLYQASLASALLHQHFRSGR